MIIYVGFYSSGMGNTAWLSSEFFPMEVRAYGTMMVRHVLTKFIHQTNLSIVDLLLLGFQHHCCIHIPNSNGKHHTVWSIWILCWHLLFWLDVRIPIFNTQNRTNADIQLVLSTSATPKLKE